METSLDTELVTMPGADDVCLAFVELKRVARLVFGQRLKHPLQDTSLANRPAKVTATVVPSVELAIDFEDSDFFLAAYDDTTLSLLEFVCATDAVAGQIPLLLLSRTFFDDHLGFNLFDSQTDIYLSNRLERSLELSNEK